MYGLILEGIAEAIRRKFGDEAWLEIKKKAGVKHDTFNTHKTYSETVIPRIAKAGSEVWTAKCSIMNKNRFSS